MLIEQELTYAIGGAAMEVRFTATFLRGEFRSLPYLDEIPFSRDGDFRLRHRSATKKPLKLRLISGRGTLKRLKYSPIYG